MSVIIQEEILRNTKTVTQGLDALLEEYEAIKSKLLINSENLTNDERQLNEEKVVIVDKNIDSIKLAIDEARVLNIFIQIFYFYLIFLSL